MNEIGNVAGGVFGSCGTYIIIVCAIFIAVFAGAAIIDYFNKSK
jgi:hypothetical protein